MGSAFGCHSEALRHQLGPTGPTGSTVTALTVLATQAFLGHRSSGKSA